MLLFQVMGIIGSRYKFPDIRIFSSRHQDFSHEFNLVGLKAESTKC